MIISAIEKLSNVTLVNDDESTNVHNSKSNLNLMFMLPNSTPSILTCTCDKPSE